MPLAMARSCLSPGCAAVAEYRGRCASHARVRERYRGTATQRGYDSAHWRPFRLQFSRLLIAAGLAPVCGAALPGGPAMSDSQCRAAGRLTGVGLHLDHDPPLRDDERGDWRKVCDPLRVGWLCESCHSRRTRRQQAEGLV